MEMAATLSTTQNASLSMNGNTRTSTLHSHNAQHEKCALTWEELGNQIQDKDTHVALAEMAGTKLAEQDLFQIRYKGSICMREAVKARVETRGVETTTDY